MKRIYMEQTTTAARRYFRGILVGLGIGITIGLVGLAVQEEQGRMIAQLMDAETVNVVSEDPLPLELRGESLGEFEVTYYDLNCATCQTDDICANGEQGVPYVTLAASSDLPFGTRLKLIYPDGSYRIGVVMDRGGAIKGNRIDILVDSHEQAIQLGRDEVEVIIID